MLRIERATSEDTEQLLELMQKQFLEHGIPFDDARLRAAIEQLLALDGLGFVLSARKNSQLVGLAVISLAWTLEHGGKSAWLDELFVLPEFRGAGIGAMLLERVVIEASESRCLAIDLEVDSEHRRAENLYARNGFKKLQRSRWVKSLN
jgi:ribosomal protein S18 acetylase RimI-like enzyme